MRIISLAVLLSLTLSGCEVVEGIFKLGVWVGVIVTLGIVMLIAWIVMRL